MDPVLTNIEEADEPSDADVTADMWAECPGFPQAKHDNADPNQDVVFAAQQSMKADPEVEKMRQVMIMIMHKFLAQKDKFLAQKIELGREKDRIIELQE